MTSTIKRVAYAYNSILADSGQNGYIFDCLVAKDGVTLVDTHQTYSTLNELYDAMEEVIPLLASQAPQPSEGVYDVSRDERAEFHFAPNEQHASLP